VIVDGPVPERLLTLAAGDDPLRDAGKAWRLSDSLSGESFERSGTTWPPTASLSHSITGVF
jgi:hypothetical protein